MIKNQEFTYIGKTSHLSGVFKFNGPTHLQGSLQGEIIVENNSKLVLEISSHTKATLECFDLDIYGEFEGQINSSGHITIYPTATFDGKMVARSIEILPGAVVNMNGHTEESTNA